MHTTQQFCTFFKHLPNLQREIYHMYFYFSRDLHSVSAVVPYCYIVCFHTFQHYCTRALVTEKQILNLSENDRRNMCL